ncbi:MAG: hypothetical protein ACPGVU_11620 [Limisphaerales bacterium]
MKIRASKQRRRGFATFLVFVVAATMSGYLMLNTTTVAHLGKSLRILEKKQLKNFQAP